MKYINIVIMIFVLVLTPVFFVFSAEEEELYHDLLVYDIIMHPAYPIAGQTSKIEIKVKNNGKYSLRTGEAAGAIERNFEDFMESKATYPEINSDNRILPGEYFFYYFEGKFLSGGEKTLDFLIDINDNLDEENEDNNYRSENIKIFDEEDVDLEVDSIELNNEEPILKENVEIVISLINKGSASLTGSRGLLQTDNANTLPVTPQDLAYSFDNFQITQFSHDDYPSLDNPLDPNEKFEYRYKGFFKEIGDCETEVEINKNAALEESNYSNNEKKVSFFIYKDEAERDDFSISNIEIEMASSTSAIVSWQTDKKTKGKIQYHEIIYIGYQEKVDDLEQITHKLQIDDLYSNKKYYVDVFSTYRSLTKSEEDVLFEMPKDNTLSIIDGVNYNKNNEYLIITWKTNMLSNGNLFFKGLGEIEPRVRNLKDYTINHEVKLKLSDLNKDSYIMRVESKSIPGTKAVSEEKNIIIRETPVIDNGVPEKTPTPVIADKQTNNQANEYLGTKKINIINTGLYNSLKGKIVLKVEANGEAYYIHPLSKEMYYLGRPEDAFEVMRAQGIGISNSNLALIPIGLSDLSGQDSDKDGLSDMFEDAIGSNKNKQDSDNDGYGDMVEINSGYNPIGTGKLAYNKEYGQKQAGKIFLAVENNGEAWYVNPSDSKRYFLGRPTDAFGIMRDLGLGISNKNLESLVQ